MLANRRSGQLFSTLFEAKRDGCVLGKPTRRRPVLPGPAPFRRPALRHPEPIRLWYVRVLDSTSETREEGLSRLSGG